VDNTKELTHLSLCSGYEGIGRGLRAVFPNLREIAYVEIETYCIANLVKEMETGVLDTAPIFSNLKTFPFGKFRGKVDILSGGFPCQPFSNAGARRGTEDPRHLFPYIRDGIRECKPRIVFLENVEGIISAKTSEGESVLQYVLRELEGMGYYAEAGVFSASEVGAPHQRKRVFILGYSKRMWESQSEGSEQDKWGRTQHSSQELGNTKGECDGLNKTKQKGGNTSSRTSQELGNTEHDGHTTAKELRSRDETSDDKSEGQNRSVELEGASGRNVGASIQGCDKFSDTENFGCGGRSDRDGDRGRSIQEQEAQEQPDLWSQAERCGGNSRGTEELGNSAEQGLQGSKAKTVGGRKEPFTDDGRDIWEGFESTSPEEVGNAKSEGLQGWLQTREYDPQGWQEQDGCSAPNGGIRSIEPSNYRFPSRPGERQQEWEAPRVTAKSSEIKRTAQPGLGGATDGSNHRIDRLRLLGNGVVPQVATKAFVTLFSRLYE